MNNTVWLNADMDLIKELDDHNYETLIEYSDSNIRHVVMAWDNSDTNYVKRILQLGRSIFFLLMSVQKGKLQFIKWDYWQVRLNLMIGFYTKGYRKSRRNLYIKIKFNL